MDVASEKIKTRAFRTILLKDKATIGLIQDFIDQNNLEVAITDNKGKIFLGQLNGSAQNISINYRDSFLGKIISENPEARYLSNLISVLLEKEIEKKTIGNEVLGLYREINMIYNLSERISEKIDAESIADIALKEANQIINSTHGVFLLYNKDKNLISEIASYGDNPSHGVFSNSEIDILIKLIIKGASAIVASKVIETIPSLSHLKSVMYAPLKVKHSNLGIVLLGNEENVEFTAAELKLLTTITLQSAAAIESAHLYQKNLDEVKQREEAIRSLHEKSQKFVPSEFIKSLGKNNLSEVSLGDQVERQVTVLFADIRGFTSLSENLNPSENFLFINSFNKRMGPIIRENKGFIMQYLGDGFMAIFPSGSQNALQASVDMHKDLMIFNEEREINELSPVKMGIGMQNGSLIMGITGDVERLDAAIISDTVNTASRIEGLSKYFGSSILLTDLCKKYLTNPEHFNFRDLGKVKVKGKNKTIDIYECFDGDSQKLFEHKKNTYSKFQKGLDLFLEKEFAMAAVTFQQIFKKNKEDLPSRIFLNRSAQLINKDLEESWEGVETIGSK